MEVTPMRVEDWPRVAAIAEASGLVVDLGAELGKDFAHGWVARAAPTGDPVAFLVGWQVADELQVIQLGTRPDARRRGAAHALLAALLALGRERHCRLAVLEVRRSNLAAIRLYRSVGFRAIGLRKRYYENDGEDAIDMMLTLDNEGNVVPLPDEILLGDAP